jgi:AmiR/NasT family two-component response regulator
MSVDPIRELRGTRVLVIHPADPEIEELLRHLRRIGCQTRVAWPAPAALPADVDVVFFSICPSGPTGIPSAVGEGGPPLIAIVDFENPTALKSLLDSNAHSVIAKPIRPSGILSSLVMARALHGYQGRLLGKVAKLEETLRSRRDIERATRILMELKDSSEDAAYQLIRQQATSQRLSMGVVARSIITAHRVFDARPAEPRPVVRDASRTVLRLPTRKSS